MTVYKGRIAGRKFAEKLYDFFIAQGYKEISSDKNNDGFVFYTMGADGKNPFYIQIKDESTSIGIIRVGVYEKYTPNTVPGLSGTFENGYNTASVMWNYTTSLSRIQLDYVVNINNERAIIFVEGLKLETWTQNSLVYLGLPKRYDSNDVNGNSAGMLATTNAYINSPVWRALRSRSLTPLFNYSYDYYYPARSYAPNNNLFFSPILIGNSDEGARGELDGIYVVEPVNLPYDIQHGDTFQKNGKTYMFIHPTLYSRIAAPNTDYVIEI